LFVNSAECIVVKHGRHMADKLQQNESPYIIIKRLTLR